MFMCQKCHDKDQDCNWGFEFHGKSQGACEICRKTSICVDCKAYKYAPPRKRKVKK